VMLINHFYPALIKASSLPKLPYGDTEWVASRRANQKKTTAAHERRNAGNIYKYIYKCVGDVKAEAIRRFKQDRHDMAVLSGRTSSTADAEMVVAGGKASFLEVDGWADPELAEVAAEEFGSPLDAAYMTDKGKYWGTYYIMNYEDNYLESNFFGSDYDSDRYHYDREGDLISYNSDHYDSDHYDSEGYHSEFPSTHKLYIQLMQSSHSL
jgi:hypothetical protein